MTQIEKYHKCFEEALGVDKSAVNENLKYNEIPEWDSIGHMTLISNLEDEFKISIETDDIVDFSSFTKGKEILKKYKVEF
jgi:acyl carrier protein